jgi:hypothetical protein
MEQNEDVIECLIELDRQVVGKENILMKDAMNPLLEMLEL